MNQWVEVLIVDHVSCNEGCSAVLNMSCFVQLKVFEVGDACFRNVIGLELIGLRELERVLIGKKSFTRNTECLEEDSNRHFCLKDCPKFRVLTIGCKSFSNFIVCEIANVPSLEGIEMGEVKEESFNFQYAEKLELKSMTSKGK